MDFDILQFNSWADRAADYGTNNIVQANNERAFAIELFSKEFVADDDEVVIQRRQQHPSTTSGSELEAG